MLEIQFTFRHLLDQYNCQSNIKPKQRHAQSISWLCVCFGLYLFILLPFSYVQADIGISADSLDSIAHYQAYKIAIKDEQSQSYITYVAQGRDGFIWVSGNQGIQRYDGYDVKRFEIEHLTNEQMRVGAPLLFADSNKNLWVGDKELHRFNYHTQSFEALDVTKGKTILSIVEGQDNTLWIGAQESGLIHYQPHSQKVLG